MLAGTPADLREAIELGISLYAGEAEGQVEHLCGTCSPAR